MGPDVNFTNCNGAKVWQHLRRSFLMFFCGDSNWQNCVKRWCEGKSRNLKCAGKFSMNVTETEQYILHHLLYTDTFVHCTN